MKKIINIFITLFISLFIFNIDVKAVGQAGTGCSKEQLTNLIKKITINEKDKFCIYKNKNYDEFYPVQFKYSSEYNLYTISKFDSCSIKDLNDNRGSQDFTSCDSYVIKYSYDFGFVLNDKNECNPDVDVCFQNDESINNQPSSTEGKSCKFKGNDIELLGLSVVGDYYVITTNKGNLCPAKTEDKGITFDRITTDDEIIDFDCDELQKKWKIVDNKDSYTVDTCKYHMVDINTEISSSFDTHDIESSGDLIATYKQFNSSAAKYIRIIENSDSSYKAVHSSGTEIESLSSELIKNNISENKKLPTYIIKKTGTDVYTFIDSMKDNEGNNLQVDELYIESNAFGVSGTGLPKEEIISTCKQLFGNEFLEFLNDYVFKTIWIGVPILLILLTSFDFAKVVFVDDKEGIQNAFTRLWKRTIAAVLIFLTPYIIIWIANLIDPNQTTVQSCAKRIRQMGNTSYIVK